MTFAQVWRDLVAGWYPGDPFQPSDAARRYYEVKWNVARRLAPSSILEIGVRAGYSAFVFMRAAPQGACYLGMDNGLCDAEARREYIAHARKLLVGMDARLWIVDAGSLRSFPSSPNGDAWDLVHVDGDHSRAGCLHDIRCAASIGRHILVDDYDTGEGIRRACSEFLETDGRGRWSSELLSDGGLAGNLLMTRVGKP